MIELSKEEKVILLMSLDYTTTYKLETIKNLISNGLSDKTRKQKLELEDQLKILDDIIKKVKGDTNAL